LLDDNGIPLLFEAGFTELGVRIRADILVRTADGLAWDLIEVKSSTSDKPVHDADIAVQSAVIEAAGVTLRRKVLLAIDTSYVFQGGEPDVSKLFKLIDRTEASDGLQEEVLERLAEMHDVIGEPDEPEITVGRQCGDPYDCRFLDYCTRGGPEHPVLELPGIGLSKLEQFTEPGLNDIGEIPDEFPLNARQRRVRETVRSGKPWVSDGLQDHLATLESPVFYLDFETFNPALPVYPGTRPYEAVPFQWSCHIDRGDGELEHQEFLAAGNGDPRRSLTERLLKCVEDRGSIVVYSQYEATSLRKLAAEFPDLTARIQSVIDRLWDLYRVLGNTYYHPDFHGSLSLKSVLPVMVPELGYDDLEISDGATASARFAEIEAAGVRGVGREKAATALREYCARDTFATVKILERLHSLV
jgi:predicted RecB family nuclease